MQLKIQCFIVFINYAENDAKGFGALEHLPLQQLFYQN
jgi:hypothetical protein